MTMEISETYAAYGAIGLAIFVAAIAFMSMSSIGGLLAIAILVICSVGGAVTYLSFRFGYLVMPMVTKLLGVSEMLGNGYHIPPAQNVVLKNVNGTYHATMFMSARFYEQAIATAQSEQTTSYMDLWERALSGIQFPFKYCLLTFLEDIAKYREDIETKRYSATLKLGKEQEKPTPDALVMDRWQREIDKMNAMLTRLTEGEKPMGVVMYAATTGIGVNEEAAIAAAERQVMDIRSSIANALNVEIKQVKGEDMRRCFIWEYFVPPERNEFLLQL